MKYKKEVIKIIKGILKTTEKISAATVLQNIGVDSLSYMEMIIGIEDLFNVEVCDDDLVIYPEMTVTDVCKIIETCLMKQEVNRR